MSKQKTVSVKLSNEELEVLRVALIVRERGLKEIVINLEGSLEEQVFQDKLKAANELSLKLTKAQSSLNK